MTSLHLEYPFNLGVPQESILGPTLFMLCINDLPDDAICNIANYTVDTTLYCKCDLVSARLTLGTDALYEFFWGFSHSKNCNFKLP